MLNTHLLFLDVDRVLLPREVEREERLRDVLLDEEPLRPVELAFFAILIIILNAFAYIRCRFFAVSSGF